MEVDEKERALAWTAEEIAEIVERTPKQVLHMLRKGQIQCARKVGGIWFASRRDLCREFGGEA